MENTDPPTETPPDYIAAARAAGLPLRQSAPIRRGPFPLELPILEYLRSKRVILASASPRRKALLSQLGLPNIEVWPSAAPEDLDKRKHTPEEYVVATARRKCLAVYEAALARQNELSLTSSSTPTQQQDPSHPAAAAAAANDEATRQRQLQDPALVIAADTVIATRDGRILEKPRSEADHVRMLRLLRDTRHHRVLTGVCALAPRADAAHPGYVLEAHVEATKVVFAEADDGLPDDVLEAYVKTREGADKAGGYAIQGVGGLLLVESVEGCVDNVIGLPVRKCLQLCEKVVFRQDEREDEAADESD
ncbi:hypothetical protein VTJ83DRAFT_2215 [Remersonia thermophila]|uniref:Uncharacterized protein n=1 Tax=Remersonia thermophila TaxID=72144 RepID=A0ABR4DI26_9PEZI